MITHVQAHLATYKPSSATAIEVPSIARMRRRGTLRSAFATSSGAPIASGAAASVREAN